MKIIAFHGFLGDEEQFNFLKNEDLTVFPINKHIDDDIDLILDHVLTILDDKSGVLIGYSFGARIAMQVFSKRPEAFSKLILLAGHAGLEDDLERVKRLEIEKQFIYKLTSLPSKEFINWWNGLDLFREDHPLDVKFENTDTLVKYFQNWGLSKQPYLLNHLKENIDKVFWFFGASDKKYLEYATANLSDFKVNMIPNQGHRVYQSNLTQKMVKELL